MFGGRHPGAGCPGAWRTGAWRTGAWRTGAWRTGAWHAGLLAFACLLAALAPRAAHAQIGSDRYSSIVVDAGTGNVLSAVNPDEPRYPASLTKLMTLYMVFEALRDHRIMLSDPVPVSQHAAMMSPSKLGLTPATRIDVEEAILGLVTKSANDAAAALGELLGGDEDRFAAMMTLRARALGMTHTVFRNASGLPDPGQVSTARDLAILARHIVADFPTYYGFFSTPSFVWHRRVIPNHDHMLETYPGADGMKTGYTQLAGHNLVTSAQRSGVRLIGVVLGAASNGERDQHMAWLLDQGFERMDVPVMVRHEAPAPRMGVFGTAQAATIEPTVRPAAGAPAIGRHAAAAPAAGGGRWAIQLGAYASIDHARATAAAGRRAADDGAIRVAQAGSRGRPVWRAEVVGLTAAEAQAACAAMARRHVACIPRRTDPGQYASR